MFDCPLNNINYIQFNCISNDNILKGARSTSTCFIRIDKSVRVSEKGIKTKTDLRNRQNPAIIIINQKKKNMWTSLCPIPPLIIYINLVI